MDKFKIMPEYGCNSPIWISRDNAVFENIEIDSLELNDEIKERLLKWNRLFQLTYNDDYPPDSGFKTKTEEKEFEDQGFNVWKLILDIYKNKFHVSYYSVLENKFIEE